MRKPISWHKECLKNWEGYIEQRRRLLAQEQVRLSDDEYKYKLYKKKVEEAEANGRTTLIVEIK